VTDATEDALRQVHGTVYLGFISLRQAFVDAFATGGAVRSGPARKDLKALLENLQEGHQMRSAKLKKPDRSDPSRWITLGAAVAHPSMPPSMLNSLPVTYVASSDASRMGVRSSDQVASEILRWIWGYPDFGVWHIL
jgi:hypothetical protein